MNREQEMEKILSREPIEVPESLLPENMKKKLLEVDNAMQNPETQKKTKRWFAPYMHAGMAVAAGLAICVLAAYLKLSDSYATPMVNADRNKTQDVAVVDGGGEIAGPEADGYRLAYESLKAVSEARQSRYRGDKDKEILTGLAEGGFFSMQTQPKASIQEDYYMTNDGAYAMENEVQSERVEEQSSDAASSAEKKKSYSDTNVRTQGVNEGDIVKTDGEYIYEYHDNFDGSKNRKVCNIYKVDGATTTLVSGIAQKQLENELFLQDMYVSGDRLILVGSLNQPTEKQIKKLYKKAGADYKDFEKESWEAYGTYDCDVLYETKKIASIVNYSLVYVFDISDREKPKLQRMSFQDGNYSTSRMVGDNLYLFSRRNMPVSNMKEEEPETYIPQVDGECVGKRNVCVPKDVQTSEYSVISSLNVQTGKTIDKKSVLAGTSEVYVSGDNIFLLDEDAKFQQNGKTVITKFSYKDGKIEQTATGKVKGVIDDDYALDEYDGHLRLVSTYYTKKNTYNALYVLNQDLKVVGSIKKIAKDERIYSARFLGDTAYFVTFRETDPLFTADLSDPKNPKIIGELKLPGFSDYLHPVGDNLLLGIGEEGDERGNMSGLKISLYDISKPTAVKEIQKIVLPQKYEYVEAMENPNALFIDEERGLVGFSAEFYDEESGFGVSDEYLVYSFDKKKGFHKKLATPIRYLKEWYDFNETGRGLYIDDIFYVVSVGANQIESFSYPDFKKKKTNKM